MKKTKPTKAPKTVKPKKPAGAVIVMRSEDLQFKRRGGCGRPHGFEAVLVRAAELVPGEAIQVDLGDKTLERAQVSISQGIRRRGLRTVNGGLLSVRAGAEGGLFVVCEASPKG